MTQQKAPVGVFDSGYGGLTILKELVKELPQYDYLYLGDNARAPYGPRSFETVRQYTLEAVQWLFSRGCQLVLLACNTASAKALRTIQQKDLPRISPDKRVLGILRPTTEIIGNYTQTGEIGILATEGTVASASYPIEIGKFFPEVKVFQQACPMWVPIVENLEMNNPGTPHFIKEYLNQLFHRGKNIDLVLLACTHYPLLLKQIQEYLPVAVKLLTQGEIVAHSLADYLMRHPEIEEICSQNGHLQFFTTDAAARFDEKASLFFGTTIQSQHTDL